MARSSLAPQYVEKLERIARHEMGHYVACRHFGFRTGNVTVRLDGGLSGGHRGGATMWPNTSVRAMAEVDEYLCRRIIILYAGALSEPLSIGAPVKAIGEKEQEEAVRVIKDPMSGAHNDHAKIRELRFLLRNLRYPDTDPTDDDMVLKELDALDKELWQRTIDVVDRYYLTICGLASQLADRVEMTGDEAIFTAAELEANPAIEAIAAV